MSSSTPGAAGWVDTHIHLLPGMDDGPANLEAALALAEAAIADGTTHAVATPHANYQFTFSPPHVAAAREQMQAHVGDRLQVMSGCELHLSYENVQAALQNPRLYSLHGSRYLLVEFAEFFERRALGNALEQFRDRGLVPVIAHPERNPVFQAHPEGLDEYLRFGCLSQVTASSFLGRFGKRAQEFSAELLRGSRIHIVASDGHSAEQRSPRMSHAFHFIEQHAGPEVASALCRDNPLAAAMDRELPFSPEPPSAKKRGLFARLSPK